MKLSDRSETEESFLPQIMILWLFPQSAKAIFPFFSFFSRHQHSGLRAETAHERFHKTNYMQWRIQHKQTTLAFKRLPTQAGQSEQLGTKLLVLTATRSLTATMGQKPGLGKE